MNNAEVAARIVENAWQKPQPWFVYMALCQDDGPIYVKVGMSQRPDRRLVGLKVACPIPIHQLYICEIGTKKKARIVEHALHIGLIKWAITGEWFRLQGDDKTAFNGAWQAVFREQGKPNRPLKWEKADVSAIRAAGKAATARYMKWMERRARLRPHFANAAPCIRALESV